MKKTLLLFASVALVAWFFPSGSLASSILPPPCCNRNETTASSQTVSIQGVSLIRHGIASLTEGLLAEQEMPSSRIPMNHLEAGNLGVSNQFYVTYRQPYVRIPVFRKISPDPEWAFY
jgi:hypothetical protein